MQTEKIVIEVPAKALHVEHVACSNGHSLIDPGVPINDYPSIKVMVQYGDAKGLVHLDPSYGSFHNIFDIDLPEGVVCDMFCPTCEAPMKIEDGRVCDWCFAPLFQLYLPKGGMIEGCLRVGCHQHKMRLVDVDEQLGMIYGHDQIQLLM